MRRLFIRRNHHPASALGGPELRDPGRDLYHFRRRMFIVGALIIVAFAGLFGRFVYLQLIQHQHYQTLAESNRIAIVPIVPNRGVVTDRNGVVLAQSYSAYTLEVTPSRVRNLDETIDELAKIVEVQPRDRKRFKRLLEESKNFESLPLRTRLSDEEVARFAVNRYRFPGVEIKARLFRQYPFGEVASHVDRLHRPHQRQGRRPHRRVGRNRELQGLRLYRQGRRRAVLRARAARHHRGRGSRSRRRRPRRAHAVAHAADIRQQPEALARHPAAAGRRGGVRRLVAGRWSRSIPRPATCSPSSRKPGFDPNLFVDGIDPANWELLNESPDKPLLNRPLRGAYPAGIDDQAVSRARGARPRASAPRRRRSSIPASTRSPGVDASIPRRQAGRSRLRRHDQVDRRVLRHLLLHARRRDRHRRHLRLHVAVRLRAEDRHRSSKANCRACCRRATGSASASRASNYREEHRKWYLGRFDLGRHRPGLQRVHAAAAGAGDRDHRQRRRRDSRRTWSKGDRERQHRRACGRSPPEPTHTRRRQAGASGRHQEGADRRCRAKARARGVRRRQYVSAGKTGTAQVYSLKGENYSAGKSTSACAITRGTSAYAPADHPKIALVGAGRERRIRRAARRRRSRALVFDYYLLGQKPRLRRRFRLRARASPTTKATRREMQNFCAILGKLWELLARRVDSYLMAAALAIVGDRADHAVLGVRPERCARDQPGDVARIRAGADVGRRQHRAADDWRASRFPCTVAAVLLLIAVAVGGTVVNGSRRWLNLGVARFQPSELMKIALPLMLAWYFQKRETRVRLCDYALALRC